MFFNMFQTNATIWICQCCGFRAWIEGTYSDKKEYSCPLCGHEAQTAFVREPTEEELAEQKKELDKLHNRRPG